MRELIDSAVSELSLVEKELLDLLQGTLIDSAVGFYKTFTDRDYLLEVLDWIRGNPDVSIESLKKKFNSKESLERVIVECDESMSCLFYDPSFQNPLLGDLNRVDQLIQLSSFSCCSFLKEEFKN